MKCGHKKIWHFRSAMWHSGLLLLLLLGYVGGELTTLVLHGSHGEREARSGSFLDLNSVANSSSVECRTKIANSSKILRFNGVEIQQRDAKISRTGKFECFVSDAETNKILSYNFVLVIDEPVDEEIQSQVDLSSLSENDIIEPFESEEVVLHCRVTDSPSQEGTIVWLYNGKVISPSNGVVAAVSKQEEFLKLLIKSANESGSYGCRYFSNDNSTKTGIFREVLIKVKFSPVVRVEGATDNAKHPLVLQPLNDFQIECKVSSYPVAKIRWLFQDKQLEFQHQISPNRTVLTVKRAQKFHQGIYKCVAENEVGKSSAQIRVKIDFLEPKIRSSLPPAILMLEDSDLNLSCLGDAKPKPRIQWLFGGKKTIVSQDADLTIPGIKKIQEGLYECQLNNSFGFDAKSVQVEVAKKSYFLHNETRSVLDVKFDSNVSLPCKHVIDDHLKDKASITWTENKSVMPSEKREILSLFSVKENAIYTCEVKTRLDEITRSFEIQVVKQPEIQIIPPLDVILALRPSDVSLKCQTHAIPPAQITWIDANSLEVLTKDSALILNRVNTDRNVSCVAENDHGATEKQVEILSVVGTRFEGENLTEIVTNAGSNLTLPCPVVVDPRCEQTLSISWLLNGNLLGSENRDNQYFINYLTSDHSGVFVCRVSTEVDEVEFHQIVKVIHSPPKIDRTLRREIKVLKGQKIGPINCFSSGIPSPEVTWKFGAKALPVIAFESVQDPDEGEYKCLAVNEYGSDVFKFQLRVLTPMKVLRGPEDHIASSLETVRFSCEISVDERLRNSTRIAWQKDGKIIKNQQGTVLTLEGVLKRDEGLYTCLIVNELETLNRTGRLTVLGDGPAFISTEKNVRTLEASNVTISCQANGLPLPEISWYRNDKKIDSDSDKFDIRTLGDLMIFNTDLEDEGSYLCRASNVYGVVTVRSYLQVIKKATSELSMAQEVVKNVGDDVSLLCAVQSDPRLHNETDYTWLKDSRVIVIDSAKFTVSENNLKIADLTLDDKGIYECQVKTPFEEKASKILLRVSGEAPKIMNQLKKVMLYENEDLNLKCLVRGVPRPDVHWLFKGEVLDPRYVHDTETASDAFRESRVSIKRISKGHEGVYHCEANNTYGSGVAKFSEVMVITRTVVNIVADGGEKVIFAHAGEKLKIPCVFKKDPSNRVTKINWTKNDKQIKIGANDRIDFGMDGSITITDVQRRHEGDYRCNVSTVLDQASDVVRLDVAVNAPVITSSSDDQMIFSGESILLMCKANGIPEPKLHWILNKTMSDVIGNDFTITNAISSDSGQYVCIAKNPYGETRKVIELTVIPLPDLKPKTKTRLGSEIVIPCVKSSANIKTTWKFNERPIEFHESKKLSKEGALIITNVTHQDEGLYSCHVKARGRQRSIQSSLSLKPNIIASSGTSLKVTEGDDVTLPCNTVPGLKVKILWKYKDKFIMPSVKRVTKNGNLELKKVTLGDEGNYVCVAVTSLGQDSIQFNLQVEPNMDSQARCGHSDPPRVENVKTITNTSVKVTWMLNKAFNNLSCLSQLKVAWWTNDTRSLYKDATISLSATHFKISDLNPNAKHFVQLNLVGPQDLEINGDTHSFFLDSHGNSAVSNKSLFSQLRSKTTLTILIFVCVICFAVIFLMALIICFKKRSRRRVKRDVPDSNDLWINRNGASATDDFIKDNPSEETSSLMMDNLLPKWPEPDPDQPEECQLFVLRSESGNSGHSGHPNQQQSLELNKSISSSWSSLFNQIGISNGGCEAAPTDSVRLSLVSSTNNRNPNSQRILISNGDGLANNIFQ